MDKPLSIREQREAAVSDLKEKIALYVRQGCQDFIGSRGQLTSEHVDILLRATRRALNQLGFKEDISLDNMTVSYNDETQKVDVEFPIPLADLPKLQARRDMDDESERGT